MPVSLFSVVEYPNNFQSIYFHILNPLMYLPNKVCLYSLLKNSKLNYLHAVFYHSVLQCKYLSNINHEINLVVCVLFKQQFQISAVPSAFSMRENTEQVYLPVYGLERLVINLENTWVFFYLISALEKFHKNNINLISECFR